jgi:hypothetical protein
MAFAPFTHEIQIKTLAPYPDTTVTIPPGHVWVEGNCGRYPHTPHALTSTLQATSASALMIATCLGPSHAACSTRNSSSSSGRPNDPAQSALPRSRRTVSRMDRHGDRRWPHWSRSAGDTLGSQWEAGLLLWLRCSHT